MVLGKLNTEKIRPKWILKNYYKQRISFKIMRKKLIINS